LGQTPDLIERHLRFEVTERIDAKGQVAVALDQAELKAVIERLTTEKVESIAVCLLNSYANPAHERMVANALAEALPGVAISISERDSAGSEGIRTHCNGGRQCLRTPFVKRYIDGLRGR